MKYTKKITKVETNDIPLQGMNAFRMDVSNLINLALYQNDNDKNKAAQWIYNIEVEGNYEDAVKNEACEQLGSKPKFGCPGNCPEEVQQLQTDLTAIFDTIFGSCRLKKK